MNFKWKKNSKIWENFEKFLWEKFYDRTLLFGTCMFLRHVFNMKISAGNEPYYCIWLCKNVTWLPKSFYGWQNRIFLISPEWNRFRVIRWYVFIIISIWTYHAMKYKSCDTITWPITWLSHVILEPVIIPKRLFLLKILKSILKKTAKKHPNRQFAQWLELIPWEHSPKERMNFALWRHQYSIITHNIWLITLWV